MGVLTQRLYSSGGPRTCAGAEVPRKEAPLMIKRERKGCCKRGIVCYQVFTLSLLEASRDMKLARLANVLLFVLSTFFIFIQLQLLSQFCSGNCIVSLLMYNVWNTVWYLNSTDARQDMITTKRLIEYFERCLSEEVIWYIWRLSLNFILNISTCVINKDTDLYSIS